MTRRKPSFQELTQTLTTADKLSIKNTAIFHAFNPHGAVAIKRASDERIADAVNDGLMKAGAHFAYGSLNDYHYNKMMRLAQLARPQRWDVEYIASRLIAEAANADAAIETAKAAQ